MNRRKFDIEGLTSLKKEDLSLAIMSLTDAFQTAPCLRYLLQFSTYDPEKEKHIHEYTLRYGLKFGHVFTTGKNMEGISIWLPPECRNNTLNTAWMFIRSGGLKLDKLVKPGTIDILKKYGDYSGKLHHESITKPHWYLMSIGVAKPYQGQGFSRKLLLPMLNYFDKYSQSCYLETHNPQNVDIYLKYGFRVTAIGTLPYSDQTHWSMLRDPFSK
ncbi:MAG: GNAT family N-acetyltransferase [Bacteroidales bacterium]|nr:GNAT family N-acetyltransferase [Bacteroidales bacterium]